MTVREFLEAHPMRIWICQSRQAESIWMLRVEANRERQANNC